MSGEGRRGGSAYPVRDLVDDGEIRGLLHDDRLWAVYPLCDIEQPYRRFARYLSAGSRVGETAVLLVYAADNFTSIIPCGGFRSLCAIIETCATLPASALFQARTTDLQAFELRYDLHGRVPMLRRVLEPANSRAPRQTFLGLRRLSDDDLDD